MPKRVVKIFAACSLLCGLFVGGWFWLKQSSLVKVQDVVISGAAGPHEAAIREALESAATDMTTLNFQKEALKTATTPFPEVRDVRATVDVPHKVRIQLALRQPVAAVELGSELVPVAADGTLLRNLGSSQTLPLIQERGTGTMKLALAIAATAPLPLQKLIRRIETKSSGVKATLGVNNVQVNFGRAQNPILQWSAFSKVYSDTWSQAPVELDVSLPDRVFVKTRQSLAQSKYNATQPQQNSTSTLPQVSTGIQTTPQSAGL